MVQRQHGLEMHRNGFGIGHLRRMSLLELLRFRCLAKCSRSSVRSVRLG